MTAINPKTWQIDGKSKAVPTYYSFTEKTGFMLHDNKGSEAPKRSDLLTLLLEDPEYMFWQLQLEDYSEIHSDAAAMVNTFSNASHLQAMGALPIQISAKGFLYTVIYEDHRVDFLDIYHQIFRGTVNWEQDVLIKLLVKDTEMFFFFTGIHVLNKSSSEDVTHLSFSGIGYKYINVY